MPRRPKVTESRTIGVSDCVDHTRSIVLSDSRNSRRLSVYRFIWQSDSVSATVPNPFSPTFGASPRHWAGRRIILDDFTRALESGPGSPTRSMVISGARGIGKTALLTELEDIAATRGWIVLRASGRDNPVADLTDTVIPGKILELDPPSRRKVSGVSIAGLGSVSTSTSDPIQPVPTINTRLRELLALLEGTGVLITVDEIQDADAEDITRLAVAYQDLVRDRMEVSLVVAGLPFGTDRLLNLPGTTFLRRAERYDLGPLTDEDAGDVIRHTTDGSGIEFTPEAVETAVDIAEGYPYLVQLIGYLCWETAQRKERTVIEAADVDRERSEAVQSMGAQVHFISLKEVPAGQRRYLSAMAELGDGPQSTADVAEALGKTAGSTSDVRARLIERDLIQPAGRGKVEFTLPHLGEWLRGPGTVRRVQ